MVRCATCHVVLDDENADQLIVCYDCESFYHLSCAKLSKETSLKDDECPWICEDCYERLPEETKDTTAQDMSGANGKCSPDHIDEERTKGKETEYEVNTNSSDLSSNLVQKMLNLLRDDIIESQKESEFELRKSIDTYAFKSDYLVDKFKDQRAVVKNLQAELDTVKLENERFRVEMAELKTRVDNLEQHNKRCTVELHGIPLYVNENVYDVFINLSYIIGVQVQVRDIDTCYRLLLSPNEPPIIIVRFLRRSVAEIVMDAARNRMHLISSHTNLPLESIYFLWSINKHRSQIWYAARRAKNQNRLKEIFIDYKGRVKVQKSADGEIKAVYSVSELNDLIDEQNGVIT